MEQAELQNDLIYLSGAETPSFQALVSHRFSDRLTEQAARRLRAMWILPERMFLKTIRATGMDLHCLYYTVLFLCLYTENGRKRRGDFLMKCACDLDDAFQSTRILSVSPLSGQDGEGRKLPDDLIPILFKEDLDRVAVRILSSFYPEALEGAPVDTEKLAERIGLHVETVCQKDDPGILGQVLFQNASDISPDPSTGAFRIRSVERGTVFVRAVSNDPDTDQKIRNNTILHECVHWILHRPAFLLHGIWHPEFRLGLSVPDPGPLSRMEKQANALSPRLLMPADPVRERTASLLNRYASLPKRERAESVIRDLSTYYGASRRLTEIRLEELGYGDLMGPAPVRSRRRYEIGAADAVKEFLRNPSFQKALFTGRYRYADRSFILRDERSFSRSGENHVQRGARYRLSFTVQKTFLPSSSGMHRYSASESTFYPAPLPDVKAMADTARVVSRILSTLPPGFSDTLVAHMKRKRITSEALSESSCISVRQLARLRNDQYGRIPLPTAVALCVGLKLHPLLSYDLIEKAGIRLNDSMEHAAYHILLQCMTDRSIFECDRFLNELHIPPLEKKER